MSKLQPAVLCLLAALPFGLSGCGKPNRTAEGPANGASALPTASAEPAKAAAHTLSEGPDVCFREVARHLGANVKVSEINSFFSSGSEIDSGDDEPKGQLTTCSVQYQNPDDPRKLLGTSLDMNTGTFAAPSPVEITVTGGDAAKFRLDDYLIPLSSVNAAALASIMEAQKARMGATYGRYAWSGVRLESPGAFSNVHMLRLDVDGRLASNDIKAGGYASITTDGKTIKTDNLKP